MRPDNLLWSGLFAWINPLLYRLKAWTRREIVDDDPWDEETLFPEPSNSVSNSNPTTDRVSISPELLPFEAPAEEKSSFDQN